MGKALRLEKALKKDERFLRINRWFEVVLLNREEPKEVKPPKKEPAPPKEKVLSKRERADLKRLLAIKIALNRPDSEVKEIKDILGLSEKTKSEKGAENQVVLPPEHIKAIDELKTACDQAFEREKEKAGRFYIPIFAAPKPGDFDARIIGEREFRVVNLELEGTADESYWILMQQEVGLNKPFTITLQHQFRDYRKHLEDPHAKPLPDDEYDEINARPQSHPTISVFFLNQKNSDQNAYKSESVVIESGKININSSHSGTRSATIEEIRAITQAVGTAKSIPSLKKNEPRKIK